MFVFQRQKEIEKMVTSSIKRKEKCIVRLAQALEGKTLSFLLILCKQFKLSAKLFFVERCHDFVT